MNLFHTSVISPTAFFLVLALTAVPARAAEPAPSVGLVQIRSTPCLMAKNGQGKKCEAPALPENAAPQQLAAAHMERAQFFIDIAELKQSLGEADQALALDPANVDIRHLVARLAMSTGDTLRAEREIKIAIEQRPGDANLRATNAVRLRNRSWLEEALREFDEILAKHPDHSFSREQRAELLLSLKRPDEAIADLDVLLADNPRQTLLLARRAAAYLAAGKPQQAVVDFTEALKENPMRPDLLTGRATAYEFLGDDTAALSDYDAFLGPIDGQPNYIMRGDQLARFRVHRAQLSGRLKRFAEAAAEMMNALNVGGRRAVLRAQVYLRQNGFPETPLDGQDSENLRTALKSCFGLNSCFERLSDSL
jgi:tetratricopeptide (TPR) repeat protein